MTVVSGTDLACAGNTTAVVTAASNPWVREMVPSEMSISGSGFTAGVYLIVGFTNAGQVTLNRTPASSGSAASNGTYTIVRDPLPRGVAGHCHGNIMGDRA